MNGRQYFHGQFVWRQAGTGLKYFDIEEGRGAVAEKGETVMVCPLQQIILLFNPLLLLLLQQNLDLSFLRCIVIFLL